MVNGRNAVTKDLSNKEKFWKALSEPTYHNCRNCKHLERFANMGMGSYSVVCKAKITREVMNRDPKCASISQPLNGAARALYKDFWEWDGKK